MTGEDTLLVLMNGVVVADIKRSDRRYRMLYHQPAMRSKRFPPVSISMPTTQLRHRHNVVPWMECLLPDRPQLIDRWRQTFGIKDREAFSLLRHVGEDIAGAAQLVRPDRLEPATAPGSIIPLTDADVAESLRRAKASIPSIDVWADTGKFSLAGAQAKIALHRNASGWGVPTGRIPSTHILKPAIPGMDDQDIGELIAMRAGRRLGMAVAQCEVWDFAGERAFVIERYDRHLRSDGNWERIHQEDMCQALGIAPIRKYQVQGGPGPAQIADLIRASGSNADVDVRRFAQAIAYNWVICGTDAHARNYSMLLTAQQARLAPIYDLNSQLAFTKDPKATLSMKIGDHYRADLVTTRDWMTFAALVGVDHEWLLSELRRIAEQLPDILADLATEAGVVEFNSPLPARLADSVSRWVRQAQRALASS